MAFHPQPRFLALACDVFAPTLRKMWPRSVRRREGIPRRVLLQGASILCTGESCTTFVLDCIQGRFGANGYILARYGQSVQPLLRYAWKAVKTRSATGSSLKLPGTHRGWDGLAALSCIHTFRKRTVYLDLGREASSRPITVRRRHTLVTMCQLYILSFAATISAIRPKK